MDLSEYISTINQKFRAGNDTEHTFKDGLKSNEWGSKVVTQLSEHLRTKDPTLKGYSRRTLYNMVMFYEEYSTVAFIERIRSLPLSDFVQLETAQMNKYAIVQTASAQLPRILCLTTFSNHLEILNRCKGARNVDKK